jgi:hypothetical protein
LLARGDAPRLEEVRTTLISLAAAAALLGLVACGDGPDATATQPPRTPVPTDATPTLAPSPVLGKAVLELMPAHAASVSQAATRTADPRLPKLPCFTASFDGLPDQARWFRVSLDGKEVTTSLTWVVQSNRPEIPPKACYATSEGLSPGRHAMTIVVRDPVSPAAAPRETINWTFDVTP